MGHERSGDDNSYEEPKRYDLHWYEGMRPDEEDMLVETVGSDE